MTIFENINWLVAYALKNSLIEQEDIIYTQNKLLELFRLDGFLTKGTEINVNEINIQTEGTELEERLNEMLDFARENKIFDDTGIINRDLFDTRIMGLLVPPPSVVINRFKNLQSENGPKAATDWFYKFSCDTNYIRRYRICKDLKWQTKTPYGLLDITINLSKPEKDPKAIAAALNIKKSDYPACLLCKENEGYAGRINHAARQNHRIIPLELAGERWYMQYSPYVYYNEHCIVFDAEHKPMKIERKTFERLLDFVTQFPHYTLGSNADLPIVGGSILTHNHFQGGNYTFPMAKASIEKEFTLKGFDKVKAGIVKWPMSVLRLDSYNKEELITAADHILKYWQTYNDEAAFIFSETNGEKHNTITPIARRCGDLYELDLVLRNNITTNEHPLGVFHPHSKLHHIKKENIGLIEVMGLAVLPSRLKEELAEIEDNITKGTEINGIEKLKKHAEWISDIQKGQSKFNKKINLKDEVGLVFCNVLEDAGVFKRNEAGIAAFYRFIDNLNK